MASMIGSFSLALNAVYPRQEMPCKANLALSLYGQRFNRYEIWRSIAPDEVSEGFLVSGIPRYLATIVATHTKVSPIPSSNCLGTLILALSLPATDSTGYAQ